jgi:hypothetical protein
VHQLTATVIASRKAKQSIDKNTPASHKTPFRSIFCKHEGTKTRRNLIHGRCACGTGAIFSSEHDWDFVGKSRQGLPMTENRPFEIVAT